jgi:diguanylate cyclase (GGDEF)-like protein
MWGLSVFDEDIDQHASAVQFAHVVPAADGSTGIPCCAHTSDGEMACASRSLRSRIRAIVTAFRRGNPGQAEFEWATQALRTTGYLGALKVGICAFCLSMAVLGVIVQFHPLGPHWLPMRIVHAVVLASTVLVGLWWLKRPWPGYRSAIAFVVWADLAVVIAAIVLSAPQSRLCATIHMGLIGVFAAFLLGWRVLAAHCAFATAVIVSITVWAVLRDDVTLLDLYIFYAPALSSVVVLPVIIQVVIEAGRRSIGTIALAAVRDPLTGLLNRRGMYEAADAMAARPAKAIIAVAAIDVDEFKQLNDNHGHSIGDAALRGIAEQLLAMIRPTDIAARIGGDEFVLITYLEDGDGLQSFIDRCDDLLLHTIAEAVVSASIGIAWQTSDDAQFSLDDVLKNADVAMYEAKRGGGNALIVQSA